MSNRCLRPLAALAAIVYLSIPGSAQPGEALLIRGEVHSESPIDFHEFRIELQDLNRHSDLYRADLHLNGEFELRHIPSGDFQLRVMNSLGVSIHQEFVTVYPQLLNLSLHLLPSAKTISAPGTVSLTQLTHPPARKAMQSFVAAQRFSESGSPEKAAAELEKAVRISPEFADAYSNLAVQHMRMRRFPEAEQELTRAIAIAGPNALMLCNLAYAQMHVGKVQESLTSVRAALRLDGGYLQAHLVLGSILAADPRTRAEAIVHLNRAAEKLPSARALLDRVRAGSAN